HARSLICLPISLSIFWVLFFLALFGNLNLFSVDLRGSFSHFRNARHLVISRQIDQLHSRSDPSVYGNIRTLHADDDSFRVDDHNLAVFIHSLHSDHFSGLFGDLVALDSLSASVLACELIHGSQLAHSLFRYDEHISDLAAYLHADHFVSVA